MNRTAKSETWETPFDSGEEAFWNMLYTQEAARDGARFNGGGGTPRPGGALDVMVAIDRLYRRRRLKIEHIRVLSHYGRRKLAPDINNPKEASAAGLWREAMQIIEEALVKKRMVRARAGAG